LQTGLFEVIHFHFPSHSHSTIGNGQKFNRQLQNRILWLFLPTNHFKLQTLLHPHFKQKFFWEPAAGIGGSIVVSLTCAAVLVAAGSLPMGSVFC
jgi:hypothetical protein